MSRLLTFAASVAILAATLAYAQTPAQTSPPARGRIQVESPNVVPLQGRTVVQGERPVLVGQSAGVNDALFAAAAADGGLTEVTLSQLGYQKATDPELKRFSQMMIEEHSRMNAELKALVDRKGIPVPQAVDARSQFCAESLAGLSGEEFDQCYAKAQLVVHMEAVATFEAEARRGMDGDVKALALKALPKIKEHLKMIKPIAMNYEKEKEAEKEHASIQRQQPAQS